MERKIIAVGIPAFKAQGTIFKTLASIAIQSISDKAKVYIADDCITDDNSYEDIIKCFPSLEIEYIPTTENTGPGLARQRALEAAYKDGCDLITFIDADDVFYDQYSLETLLQGFNSPEVVVSQGSFLQKTPMGFVPRNDVGHPWVFGRLYAIKFLKENQIEFSHLRCMEDGEFNAKIRMLIEGTPLKWNITDRAVYYWNEGSEHSITRTIWKGHNNDMPIYNLGGCSKGAAICFKRAIEFVAKKNPFNPSIVRTASELMVDKYFTYFESVQNFPEYAEQNAFIASWWYHNVFLKYAPNVEYETLEQIFMNMLMSKAGTFKAFPEKTFKQFYDWIKELPYDNDALKEIRSRIPAELLALESNSGSNEEM